MNSFYSMDELANIGFKSIGKNIFISKKASIYSPQNIELGNFVRIDDFSILSAGNGWIKIGNYIHIAAYSALYGSYGIEMNDYSGLSGRVSLYSESDDYSGYSMTNPMIPSEFKPKIKKGTIILKKHVIIGSGAVILPKVTLEEGVAIGANSLVTKSCEAWSIMFGNPAKKISSRAKKLLELEKQFLNQ